METQLTASVGINPPIPSQSTSNDDSTELSTFPATNKNWGQRLLSLVRLFERQDIYDENFNKNMDHIVGLMNNLISRYSCSGLLEANLSKAEQILSFQKKNPRDRNPKKGSTLNKDFQVHEGDGNGEAASDLVVQPQETLVLTSIIRILCGSSLFPETSLHEDGALLIALAAEVCVAITQHIKAGKESDICVLAAYEVLAESGKLILSGLIGKLQLIIADIRQHTKETTQICLNALETCLTLAVVDDAKHAIPVLSCLKALSALVGLFGTKISRNTALLSDMRQVGWALLTLPYDSIQRSAARLLSRVPLAGGIDWMGPSDIWNSAVADSIFMLSKITHSIAPLNNSAIQGSQNISEESKNVLDCWIRFVREGTPNEAARVNSFHLFIRGLTRYFEMLLLQDGMGQAKHALMDAKISVEDVLDVVETFLCFSISAETIYFKTKKRLRNESIDGGMISPNAISTQVANRVKLLGHGIFDSLLSSMGGPPLFPYCQRIIRIAYASLLTACSGPVRKVLDPTSPVLLTGKKQRWLHLSIPLRTVAINTVQSVVLAFGSDHVGKSSLDGRSGQSRSAGEMAITLVAGCIMEQIARDDLDEDTDESWGTLKEKVDLLTSSLNCLKTALISWGGFLEISIRSMIDSVVLTCMIAISDSAVNSLFSWAAVKVSLFELASTCVTTPWNDGASTSIAIELSGVARKFHIDGDFRVSTAAQAASRVCDASGVPRAPPLVMVSRETLATSLVAQEKRPASEVFEKIQKAKKEAAEARKLTEISESASDGKNQCSDEQNEGENTAKRKKTEDKVSSRLRNELLVGGLLSPTSYDPQEKSSEVETCKGEDPGKTISEAPATTSPNPPEFESVGHDNVIDIEEGANVSGALTSTKNDIDAEGENEGEEMIPGIVDGGPDSEDD